MGPMSPVSFLTFLVYEALFDVFKAGSFGGEWNYIDRDITSQLRNKLDAKYFHVFVARLNVVDKFW